VKKLLKPIPHSKIWGEKLMPFARQDNRRPSPASQTTWKKTWRKWL